MPILFVFKAEIEFIDDVININYNINYLNADRYQRQHPTNFDNRTEEQKRIDRIRERSDYQGLAWFETGLALSPLMFMGAANFNPASIGRRIVNAGKNAFKYSLPSTYASTVASNLGASSRLKTSPYSLVISSISSSFKIAPENNASSFLKNEDVEEPEEKADDTQKDSKDSSVPSSNPDYIIEHLCNFSSGENILLANSIPFFNLFYLFHMKIVL